MSLKHWGEIENSKNDVLNPDVSSDIERSMNKFCLADFKEAETEEKFTRIILPPMDPLIMYAINLHKYLGQVQNLIDLALKRQLPSGKEAVPVMPERPEIKLTHERNNINFIPEESTSFKRGEGVEMPELSEYVVKKILTKSVATMFAHIGYETTQQITLDILTDVLETFLQKFCRKVKTAIEDEEKHSSGFPNVMERVLTETGMGGVKGLHDYYQNRVIKYLPVLEKRCKDLNDYYLKLVVPRSFSPTEPEIEKLQRIKTEQEEYMDTDNPEMHFTMDRDMYSTLEHGYQLLNSLEAESNFQNIPDAVEDI